MSEKGRSIDSTMADKKHTNQKTGRNYNHQYIPGDSRPNMVLRDRIYAIYPEGAQATTPQILKQLARDANGFVPYIRNLHKCLNLAVEDGEISRERINMINPITGRNNMVVLWTFLARPDPKEYYGLPPVPSPVQLDASQAENFLDRLKNGLTKF
jgi:hypothetical protein